VVGLDEALPSSHALGAAVLGEQINFKCLQEYCKEKFTAALWLGTRQSSLSPSWASQVDAANSSAAVAF